MFTSSRSRGFTLIELMVVIAIIGLLASTVLASVSNTRVLARDTSRVQAVKELQKALELYRNANGGNYPCAVASCPAVGSAAGAAINTATANNVTTDIAAFFKPQTDTNILSTTVITTGILTTATLASVMYRTGSAAGNSNDAPDRSTYTILLRREQAAGVIPANTWCKINAGGGHTAWAGYANCF